MKKELFYALSAVLVLSLSIPVIAVTDMTNPGFETGDFTGWDLTVPPGASAAVVSGHTSDGGTNYTPPAGDYFALLKTDGPGSETIISQTFIAAAGNEISGQAFFDAQDYVPFNDYAYVVIIDPAGDVTTVFYSDIAATGDYGETPWTDWEYICTSAGLHTIVAGIANEGDSVLDSYMGIDIVYTIACDIKPGSWPNPINLKSKGVIPVAILGSAVFDVTTIDPDTLNFESADAAKWALEDVNGDGYMDLIAHFKTQEASCINAGDTIAHISWYLFDGTVMECYDEIRIVPKD